MWSRHGKRAGGSGKNGSLAVLAEVRRFSRFAQRGMIHREVFTLNMLRVRPAPFLPPPQVYHEHCPNIRFAASGSDGHGPGLRDRVDRFCI
jgi:hypothetical protein